MTDKETKAPKPKAEETVTIPKSTLEKLLGRVDRLEYAASNAQLANYDSRQDSEEMKEASVSVFNGNIVTAWKVVKDIVEKIC